MGHGGIDHAREEATLADATLRMAEGRHDLEAEPQKPRSESSSMTSPFKTLTGSLRLALRTFSASASLSAAMSMPAKSGWVELMRRGL